MALLGQGHAHLVCQSCSITWCSHMTALTAASLGDCSHCSIYLLVYMRQLLLRA